MENKEKIIEKLKGLYFEWVLPPGKPKPNEPLDQLLALNDINVFFELWESNDVNLRAWAWKGIIHFIEGLKDSKQIEKVQQIAIELLKDNREITVYSGDVMRHPKLCMLHIRDFRKRAKPIILKPVLEFLKSEETQTNEAVADLLFDFYSEISDSEIEPLILRHAKNVGKSDFKTKFEITKDIKYHFEKTGEFKNKEELIKIFNNYLKDIEQDVTEAQETHKSKKFSISRYKQNIRSNIIVLAAQMNLGFEKETFDLIREFEKDPPKKFPPIKINREFEQSCSWVLPKISERYAKNEKFLPLLLEKFEKTRVSSLASDILRVFINLGYPNWKNLFKDFIRKYKSIDSRLLWELDEYNVVDEEILSICITKGHLGQYQFVTQYLEKYSEKLDLYPKLLDDFSNILKSPSKRIGIVHQKKAVLEVIEKLKRKDMIEGVLFNLRNAENKHIITHAAVAIGEIGGREHLAELQQLLEKLKDIHKYSMFGTNEILNAINKIKSRLEKP